MRKVEVLSVGTELLMGQIANTNAQYISKRLPEAGLGVYYHSVVGDNPERLADCLRLALRRSDVVITTGGLGPTQDDLTKDVVAETLGLPMELHEPSRDRIREYFQRVGRVMVESNFRQAYFPKGCQIIENDEGTAPGCIICCNAWVDPAALEEEGKEKVVIMLPGPPRELIPMFDRHVLPFFLQQTPHPLVSKFLRIVGVGESLVEERILSLVNGQTNPTLATYAKDGIVTIRITASGEHGESPEALVEDMSRRICEILGDSVYTTENEELEQTVFRLLRERGLSLALAESCTGGFLSGLLTAIPGASEVFRCGAITYTNSSKMQLLHVKPETIQEFGAVSKETAREMVQGICWLSGADVGVSVTGYAGPSGGEDKPVGLVYIGVKVGELEEVLEYRFSGNRERIRTLSAVNALDRVRRALLRAET